MTEQLKPLAGWTEADQRRYKRELHAAMRSARPGSDVARALDLLARLGTPAVSLDSPSRPGAPHRPEDPGRHSPPSSPAGWVVPPGEGQPRNAGEGGGNLSP